MLAALDVSYRDEGAVAACVLFRGWSDPAEVSVHVARIPEVASYEPGAFYRRELPCLLAVLGEVQGACEAIVIDGYVWLSDDQRPGLGAHLFRSAGAPDTDRRRRQDRLRGLELRGAGGPRGSSRPLFVTAAGVEPAVAAGWIGEMHGAYRLPTLLKRVDRLCRDTE